MRIRCGRCFPGVCAQLPGPHQAKCDRSGRQSAVSVVLNSIVPTLRIASSATVFAAMLGLSVQGISAAHKE